MNISYDEIRSIYRLERNTNKLVEVEDDFFDSLNSFVAEEKKHYLAGLRDLSASKARDFINLKKMVEEIFLIREKKLLNKALICSRTGEIEKDKLALQERKTLDELLKVLEVHHSFLGAVFGEEKPLARKNAELVPVMILKTLPSFVGSDMKEYGPFEDGMTVELPFKVAGLLVSRGLARQE